MKRSPLKTPPLPQAGQSLGERIEELISDKRLMPVLLAFGAIIFAALEWARSLLNSPPRPIEATIIAGALLGYAVFALLSTRNELRNLRLGMDGERFVGQQLETLRAFGYEVFHDLCCEGFNIDHVLVGPGGVFTIETKTRSRPMGRDCKVTYDGTVIRIDGQVLDPNPVNQAKGQAAWLRDLIKSTTRENVKIRPIVVFPEWYVDSPGNRNSEVWVLNDSGVIAFVRNERDALPSDKISLITHHLKLHIQHTLRQIK